MRKHGFTLVELLVVVAIIAIIAAMILPVLLQVKDSARMKVCVSNLKQLGQAIMRYVDDHNGYGLPPAPSSFRNPWVLCVKPLLPAYIPQCHPSMISASGAYPYLAANIGAEEKPNWIWRCPGDTSRGTSELVERPCWWVFGSSYRYPGPTVYMSGDRPTDRTKIFPRKPLLWRNHKRDILLADNYDDLHTGSRAPRKLGDPTDTSLSLPGPWMKVRSVNVLFLDLHARAMTPEERKECQDTYVRRLDNPYNDTHAPCP